MTTVAVATPVRVRVFWASTCATYVPREPFPYSCFTDGTVVSTIGDPSPKSHRYFVIAAPRADDASATNATRSRRHLVLDGDRDAVGHEVVQEPERRLRSQLAAVRVQALEPDVEQRCVPPHERVELAQRRVARDAGDGAVREAGDRDAVLLRGGVAAEHARVRLHLGAVVHLDAEVVAIRGRDGPARIREPLVAGPGAAQVRAHVTRPPEQRERRLELGRGRIRRARAVEVPVAAGRRARCAPLRPGQPPGHGRVEEVAARVLVVGHLRVQVLSRHHELPAGYEVVLERERSADVRVRPAREVVAGEEDDRAVALELRVRRAGVSVRGGRRAAVEDVVAQPEAVQRRLVDRPEVGADVAVPVDQQDVLRDGRILDAHEVRDRVRLAAARDLDEPLVVAGRRTRGAEVDRERRTARRRDENDCAASVTAGLPTSARVLTA